MNELFITETVGRPTSKSNINDLINHINITEWNSDNENILLNLYEQSQIYSNLHFRCYSIFKWKYYFLTIPIIILSSLTGSANLALSSFELNQSQANIFNLVIGVLGIIITIISTLSNLFKYQSRKEQHYNYHKKWNKISNLIEIELNLNRDKRNECKLFFNLVHNEFNNILENQPNISEGIRQNFIKKYKKKKYEFELPTILKLKKITIVPYGLSEAIKNEPVVLNSNIEFNENDDSKSKDSDNNIII